MPLRHEPNPPFSESFSLIYRGLVVLQSRVYWSYCPVLLLSITTVSTFLFFYSLIRLASGI